jgi:RHS repeat-associated protein
MMRGLLGVIALLAGFAFASESMAATTVPLTTYVTPTTWTLAGSPYLVLGDVTVASGASLTIQAGVVVKFGPASFTSNTKKIVVASGATLSVTGTASSPVLFTGIQEDSLGGDDGGDGPSTCWMGQGGHIQVQSSGANLISHAVFRCGGYGQSKTTAPIRVSGAGALLTVNDTQIERLHGSGIYVEQQGSVTVTRVNIDTPRSVGVMAATGATATLEDVMIVGGRPNPNAGHGVRAEDATVHVSRSWMTNLEFGAVVQLSSTFTGAGSTFTDNTIRGNNYGIYLASLGSEGLPPLAYQATGHRNNIYDNDSSSQAMLDKQQLNAHRGAEEEGLDWRNNYWGKTVSWWPNPPVCNPATNGIGYLAYPDATESSPKGPVYWDLSLADAEPPPWPSVLCRRNWINAAGNGTEFATTPFNFVPVEQTIGCGDGIHAADSSGCDADPVDTLSGAFTDEHVDLSLASGYGVPFIFARSYASNGVGSGRLGPGWRDSYSAELELETNGDVTLHAESGQLVSYLKQPDGSFEGASPGVRSRLVETASGYELTRPDQVRYSFGADGKLLSMLDRNSEGLSFNWTASQLTTITDSFGRAVTLSYNAANLLEQLSLPAPDNRVVSYGYSNGHLSSVTDARGKLWNYDYTPDGKLKSLLDPNNHFRYRVTYAAERVTEVLDPLGNPTSFAWDELKQTATTTDADGKQWKTIYLSNLVSKRIDPLLRTTTYIYDKNANLVRVTDPMGGATGMEYDERSNLTRRTSFAVYPPASESWTYNTRNDVTAHLDRRGKETTYSYDAAGNLTEETAPGGLATLYGRDPAGTGLLVSLTDPLERISSFEASEFGLLGSSTTPLGHKTSYLYDEAGRLESVVGPRGNVPGCGCAAQFTTSFSYDNAGHKLTETDALGRTTTSTYDDVGNLITVANALDKTWSYEYNAADERVREIAPGNVISEIAYDTLGRVVQTSSPEGAITKLTYDDAGQLKTKIGPRGNVQGADPLQFTWTYDYDANGNRTSVLDPLGNETKSVYDGLGRPVTTTAYDQGLSPRVTQRAYDANGNTTRVVDATGAKTETTYDDFNRPLTKSLYEIAPGQYRSSVLADGPLGYWRLGEASGTVGSDASGNALDLTYANVTLAQAAAIDSDTDKAASFNGSSSKGSRSIVTTATSNFSLEAWVRWSGASATATQIFLLNGTYNVNGYRVQLNGVSGANSRVYVFKGATAFDTGYTLPANSWTHLVATVDASSNLRFYVNGALSYGPVSFGAVTVPTGETVAGSTGTTRFFNGRLDELAVYNTALSANRVAAHYADAQISLKTTSFEYEDAGSLTKTTSPAGNVTTYAYDDDGRLASSVEPRGHVVGADPLDYTTSYAYDPAGNLTSTTDPLQNVTTYTYDRVGHRKTRTDANLHTLTWTYDELGRLTKVKAHDNSETGYGYDDLGNLSSRTDAKQHVTNFGYDDDGRLTSVLNPLNQEWTYRYDAAGNLIEKVDPNGNATPADPNDGKTVLGYDRLERLTSSDYSDAADLTYSYNGFGERTSISDGAGSETYLYDAASRIKSVSRGIDTFAYAYDYRGNVVKRTLPDATSSIYSYDDDGRLATVSEGGSTVTYTYDAAGNQLGLTLPAPNGYIESRAYDRAGQLAEIKNAKGATVLSQYNVERDGVGNPTQVLRSGSIGSQTENYSYDALDRLTEVCYQAAPCLGSSDPFLRWTYDLVGNRETQARPGLTGTYSYDDADRLTQLTTVQAAGPNLTTNYSYDEDGHTTAIGARSFTWNAADQITSTSEAGNSTTYAYDGLGKRISATTAASTTKYLWDVNYSLPQLALERDSSGAHLRRYVHGNDTISMTTSSEKFSYHYDNMGSVAHLSDSAGAVQWSYGYEPFGTASLETKNVASAPDNPLRYTHAYLDPTTSLYHLRARDYAPASGRFLSIDPLAPALSDPYVSAYVYADNRPSYLIDPSGLRGTIWSDLADGIRALNGVAEDLTGITDIRNCFGDGDLLACGMTATLAAPLVGRLVVVVGGRLVVLTRPTFARLLREERGELGLDWLVPTRGEALPAEDAGALAGRDALGRFTGAGGYGAASEARGLSEYELATGQTVIRNHVRATLSGGGSGRYYDGLIRNADGTYTGIEVKSGSASLTASQRAFDNAVNASGVARAMLNGRLIEITSTDLVRVR